MPEVKIVEVEEVEKVKTVKNTGSTIIKLADGKSSIRLGVDADLFSFKQERFRPQRLAAARAAS